MQNKSVLASMFGCLHSPLEYGLGVRPLVGDGESREDDAGQGGQPHPDGVTVGHHLDAAEFSERLSAASFPLFLSLFSFSLSLSPCRVW